MDARRPILSPSHPHRNDPHTVPVMATNAIQTTGVVPTGSSGDSRPYSAAMPGMTNANAVGFMTSIVTARAIASSKR